MWGSFCSINPPWNYQVFVNKTGVYQLRAPPPSVSQPLFWFPPFHVLSRSDPLWLLLSQSSLGLSLNWRFTLFNALNWCIYLSVFFSSSLQALLPLTNLLGHFTTSSLLVILWILLFLSPPNDISWVFEYLTFEYKLQLLVLSPLPHAHRDFIILGLWAHMPGVYYGMCLKGTRPASTCRSCPSFA